MNTSENKRNFPIKFYKNTDGTIVIESLYFNRTAKSLADAFNLIMKQQEDILYDLYMYDDVIDIDLGSYEIAEKPLTRSHREYLGKINVKIDLSDIVTNNTLKVVMKNKDLIKSHDSLVRLLKRDDAWRRFSQRISGFFQNIKYRFFA